MSGRRTIAARRGARFALGAGIALALGGTSCGAQAPGPDAGRAPARPGASRARAVRAFVRVDQVGFPAGARGEATLMSTAPVHAPASLVQPGGAERTVALGRDRGPWNAAYRHVYPLDLGVLAVPGSYRVILRALPGAASPRFAVSAARGLFDPLVGHAVDFFTAQRDGTNVVPGALGRRPAHLADRHALVYQTPRYKGSRFLGRLAPTRAVRDVAGGWFDAGDYLKFAETASFSDVMLSFTALHYADAPLRARVAAEARVGSDWLLKVWHGQTGELDYQVGIGNGQGERVLGDHDLWRLPERDDRLPGAGATRYLRRRPVLRTGGPGAQLSPNLAGRLAAAFGLCAQMWRPTDPRYADRCLRAGRSAYAHARTRRVGTLVTATPHDFYPQAEWRGDMALGATELYSATLADPATRRRAPGYLAAAARWSAAAMSAPDAGADSFNLYDLSGLVDFELGSALTGADRRRPGTSSRLALQPRDLHADLADQLRGGERTSARDPFRLADPFGVADAVPHALGYALESGWYSALTGSARFAPLGRRERDWVLGDNAWGSSFVVGAGTTFPHCPQHQVANLRGSLDGRGRLLLGATVDGPNDPSAFRGLGLPDGYRKCPGDGRDRFRQFSTRTARYQDSVVATPSVEPTDDYTALALAAFAQAGAGG